MMLCGVAQRAGMLRLGGGTPHVGWRLWNAHFIVPLDSQFS